MRSRGPAALLTVLALSVVAMGCGSTSQHVSTRSTEPDHPTTTVPATTTAAPSTTSASTTTAAAPGTTTSATTPAPAQTEPVESVPPPPAPPATSPATPAPPAPLLVTQLNGIDGAQQVITVAADAYGTSAATVTAFEHDASGWKQVFGPWSAYIGRNGVAPAGQKREGDGRTPSGVYGFDFMFGVEPDPGVQFSYRHITGSNIVWDDDPASPNYNEWIDTNTSSGGTASAGVAPEPMDNVPSYEYGAVIAYNDARTPGLGSAIFLHVSHGSSTAGCVSLPIDELLELLRWLDPARDPRIAIGTLASLT